MVLFKTYVFEYVHLKCIPKRYLFHSVYVNPPFMYTVTTWVPHECIVLWNLECIVMWNLHPLSLCLSLPDKHSSIRILPSVTFNLVEGFETAECSLILSPHLSEVGATVHIQPGIYSLCTILSRLVTYQIPKGHGVDVETKSQDCVFSVHLIFTLERSSLR